MPSGEWETVSSKKENKMRKIQPNAAGEFPSHYEEYINAYIDMKIKDQCKPDDFDTSVRNKLLSSENSLFQVIQVIYKFNLCVDEHVYNRRNYLIGILKKTKASWENDANFVEYMSTEFRPETVDKFYDIASAEIISPDVFSPTVCLALLSLSPTQMEVVISDYVTQRETLDSFHRRHEVLISLCGSMLGITFVPAPNFDTDKTAHHSNDEVRNGSGPIVLSPIDTTQTYQPGTETQATTPVSTTTVSLPSPEELQEFTPEKEAEARQKLPGLLNAFISSKCANDNVRRSDFDTTAREALNRMSFIQALQAIEHFAGSVSPRINKRPAYLMGILRGQDVHWDKSRAAAQCAGGSAELLNLSPVVLVHIADLCLNGNCMPSDFTPEVYLALRNLSPVLAVKAISAFNSNKRIVAGYRGGVGNRPRFFQRLIQNVEQQHKDALSNQNNSPDSKSRDSIESSEEQPRFTFDQHMSESDTLKNDHKTNTTSPRKLTDLDNNTPTSSPSVLSGTSTTSNVSPQASFASPTSMMNPTTDDSPTAESNVSFSNAGDIISRFNNIVMSPHLSKQSVPTTSRLSDEYRPSGSQPNIDISQQNFEQPGLNNQNDLNHVASSDGMYQHVWNRQDVNLTDKTWEPQNKNAKNWMSQEHLHDHHNAMDVPFLGKIPSLSMDGYGQIVQTEQQNQALRVGPSMWTKHNWSEEMVEQPYTTPSMNKQLHTKHQSEPVMEYGRHRGIPNSSSMNEPEYEIDPSELPEPIAKYVENLQRRSREDKLTIEHFQNELSRNTATQKQLKSELFNTKTQLHTCKTQLGAAVLELKNICEQTFDKIKGIDKFLNTLPSNQGYNE